MPDLPFVHQHRVSYADCTVGNHIYYARYLDLLEQARGEFFRLLGLPFLELQQRDTIFPVVECRLRYKAPARYDDILNIEVWPTAADRVRLNFAYRITRSDNTVILLAETQHVCTTADEKLKRLPPELAAKLQPLVRSAE
jgi:acyl-CoA thioester hydrolase